MPKTNHPSHLQKQVLKKVKKRLRASQTLHNLRQNLLKLLARLQLQIQTQMQEAPNLKPFLKPFLLLKREPLRRKLLQSQRRLLKPKRSLPVNLAQTLSLLQMINQTQKLPVLLKSLLLLLLLLLWLLLLLLLLLRPCPLQQVHHLQDQMTHLGHHRLPAKVKPKCFKSCSHNNFLFISRL